VLVGPETWDDAGIYALSATRALVQTVDFFTPMVNDPFDFGRIAATNALSDVYAMGGTPTTALSIVCYPESGDMSLLGEILRGGADTLRRAGVALMGGHSVRDKEIKFGFAVTGVVGDGELVTNAGARPGDLLVLTKPLGTGIVALASQLGRAAPESVETMTASMVALNRAAAEIMVRHGATACTDVTGFGLMGHLAQLVLQSGVTAEIWAETLPLLPGALEAARQGIFSGANERNAEFSEALADFEAGIGEGIKAVLFDAQTSGGLLIAFPPERAEAALAEMRAGGAPHAAVVGYVAGRSEGGIRIAGRGPDGVPRRDATVPAEAEPPARTEQEKAMTDEKNPHAEECCADGSGTPDQAFGMFQDFMGTALRPGALDVVTKELVAVALALAVHCVPCAKIHLRKAKEMGIGDAELEEAAAIATAFSGCRAMMLWNELKEESL
jgi:selenide,water dikinase